MKRLLPVLYLISSTIAGTWTIDHFENAEAFGSTDDYITADFNNELRPAQEKAIKDGRFYIRQKYEDPFDEQATSYQIFEGKKTKASQSDLGRFSSDEIPFSELLKTKFYRTKDASPDMDEERVYFDAEYFYLQGESPVYINIDGEMQALKPVIAKEAFIDITSKPSGAAIFMNGTDLDKTTPSKIKVSADEAVVFNLKKEGYYTGIRVIQPSAGQTIKDGILLIQKEAFPSNVESYKLKRLEYAKNGEKAKLQELRQTIEEELDSWSDKSDETIERILAKYPPNPDQKSDESAEDYKARTESWEADRQAEEERLKESAADIEDELKEVLSAVKTSEESSTSTASIEESEEDTYSSSSEESDYNDYGSSSDSDEYAYNDNESTEEESPVDFSSQMDESLGLDMESEESVGDAVDDINAQFGRADEYRKWAGWGFAAIAAACAGGLVYNHMKYKDSQDDYNKLTLWRKDHINNITALCSKHADPQRCQTALITFSSTNPENGYLYQLDQTIQYDKDIMDSYSTGRTLFILGTAASVAASVVLFTW